MDGRFLNRSFVSHHEQEDYENSPENSGDSPRSSMLNDGKMACISSPKKSGKRSIQKRVVSVPIKDVEGPRLKGEMGAPPSDSWAWRKYGQKPIKGSPYPRGYYRCSSSKGCPARKQVERSRADPNMLIVTYSSEHNHPGPAQRNQNHHNQISHNSSKAAKITRREASTISTNSEDEDEEEEEEEKEEEKPKKFASQAELINSCNNSEKFVGNIGDGPSLVTHGASDHVWFSEFECTTSSTMLESPILTEDRVTDFDMAMSFTMRAEDDEDESFFADLGELPECSTVFRRGMMMERDEERRRLNLTPWCGTT